MEEVYLTLIIIIILLIILYRKKENFISNVDEVTKKLFLNNLENLFGISLYQDDIEVLKLNNSKKIIIKNYTKKSNIENSLFINNFEFSRIKDKNGDINTKLKYILKPLEPKKNIFSGYYVSPNLKTPVKNSNYGFYFEYNPELEFNNIAEISIDFNENQYNNIEHLHKIKKNKNSDTYYNKPRRSVKIYSSNNTPPEFINYFARGDDGKDIKLIAVFTSQNNSEFLKSFPDGKFNVLDNNLIPILTYVDIDKPFCNIELDKRGNFYGRDKLIAGRYLPEYKKYAVLDTPEFKEFKDSRKETDSIEEESTFEAPTESFIGDYINERFATMNEHFTNELEITESNFEPKYINYEKLSDCKKKENRTIMKELIDNKQFSLLNKDSLSLKKDKNIFNKLEDITGLSVRKHKSQNKYYYGGIDNNGIMKCLGSEGKCDLFDNEENVIKGKTNNNEFVEMLPLDEVDPGFIGEDLKEKYIKYNNFDCIKHRKNDAPCKHLLDRKIVDIITFKKSNESDPVEIINNNKIFDIHYLLKQKFQDENISEFDEEYKKAMEFNYLIEPYNDENKDIDLGKIFETFQIKIRIEDSLKEPVRSIVKIIQGDKIDILKEEDNKNLILKKKDKIHLVIDKKNRLRINILRNDNIISTYLTNKTINGKFGKDINLFLRTNNTNIFQNFYTTEKLSDITYPYNPFVDVKAI